MQFLVLLNTPQYPSLIEYSDNIRQLDALRDAGLFSAADAARLQDIYRRYRQRQHRLALDEQLALVPAGEFADEVATVNALWRQAFE